MNNIITEAKSEFESARFNALLNNLKSYISGKENKLLSFEEISKGLNLHNQKYLGIRTVDVDDIVGSIDRYKDFDRFFLPVKTNLEHRWSNIYSAYKKNIDLPLVKLYKVGNIYFVLDGNHRLSVAKRMGIKYLDAEVIEFTTKIPVSREMDPIDMFILAEREKFLNLTKLKKNRPNIKIRLTVPGKYDFLSLPAINIIDKYKIIENFPNRTKSDLFVWIIGHKYYLKDKYGKEIELKEAAYDFSTRFSEGLLPGVKLMIVNFLKKIHLKKQKGKRF